MFEREKKRKVGGKLRRREVGQGAMMIFHSTRCSGSLCNPLKGLFIVQTHLHSLPFLSSSRELIPCFLSLILLYLKFFFMILYLNWMLEILL